MNESTNNQAPKKSFWAKLFGGKDNTQAQPAAQPIPVPPANQTVAQAPTSLSDTPPASELSPPPAVDPIAPSQGPSDVSVPSQDFSSTPAGVGVDQMQNATPSEFVAQPPLDPMVTPISTLSQVDAPTPVLEAQAPTEEQPNSFAGSDLDTTTTPVQDIAPVVAPLAPDNPVDPLGQFGEVPSSSSIPSDEQTPPNSPVV